ncbi:GTP binding protein [Coemansia spiralis]|uniref:GTP binding protein n=2 Tax=Coemansia TaxID=4863 RepID=A0A9W8KY10_9FUNG|nr:GTP binding protein [Coemansia umbellata]KAJ2624309.1 GTP binding protein [Coemansia sp. RSA 1358]KAJ2675944.1 GTP binding protein [Coemansia spiralis]
MTTRDTMYSEDNASCSPQSRLSVLDENIAKLPPEMDRSGNVEYKTKLDAVSDSRATHLATQLQWRLAEGNGHAVYVVGVRDDGELVGIAEEELEATICVLRRMASQLTNVSIVSIKKRVLLHRSCHLVAEIHLDQHNNLPRTEVRIAVLGDHGVGKSTVLGCLTYGEADNGRGKARLNLLRHRHEVESGRTSSITLGTVGFDANGQVLNYANNRSAEQIYQRSRHVVTLIDTCGYAKHLKTTARAITGHSPHVFCVAIAADRASVTPTTREYLRMAAVLKMPLMISLTKMDIATKASFAALMHDILAALDTAVPGRGRCIVTNISEGDSLAEDMMGLVVVPIFTTSAVRTLGFNELTAVLAKSRQPLHYTRYDSLAATSIYKRGNGTSTTLGRPSVEFHIEHTYSIDEVGTVVTGWVNQGSIRIGASADNNVRLAIGPDSSGQFIDIEVTSIHTLRIPTVVAEAGMSAALAIKPHKPVSIEKGMVILDTDYIAKSGKQHVSGEFIAQVAVLSSEFQTMQSIVVHIRSAYRLAHVLEIITPEEVEQTPSSTLSQARPSHCYNLVAVRLKFDDNVYDYLSPGLPVIARDGQSLTFVGHIEKVL